MRECVCEQDGKSDSMRGVKEREIKNVELDDKDRGME